MSDADIHRNSAVHDRLAQRYDDTHGEIFNKIEQSRLRNTLGRSLALVSTGATPLRALDFGAGTGNLTRHLIAFGAEVTAADVSCKSLEVVHSRFGVETAVLNGKDLCQFADDSFDVVGCYSVLHHVPDYLKAVREMARVCRPGGILYIDHEPTEAYWESLPAYRAFRAAAEITDYRKYLYLSNYIDKFLRLFNPRRTNEGDIHVWLDDHVEWSLVIETLHALGFETVLNDSFLLYRANYRLEVYEAHKNKFQDTRAMAFQKQKT